MRIFVTGSSGWVARWFIRHAADAGHQVHGCDLRDPDPATERLLDRVTRGDVRDPDAMRLLARDADAVVHLAARYGRVWCESRQAEAFDVNVAGTAVVAEVCQEASVPLIVASSSEVYGFPARSSPRIVRTETERDGLRPLNTYGETKLMAEKAALRIVDPELLAIWRLNMPYGPGGRPGDSGVPGYGYNALHTWIWQAIHGLPLTVYRDTARSWTWVGDVADAMLLLLEAGHRGTVNVCSSRDMRTSRDTAQAVLDLVESSSTIRELDAPADVTPWKQLDDRILYGLGWAPAVDLAEGIGLTAGYMQDRFDKWGRWVSATAAQASA